MSAVGHGLGTRRAGALALAAATLAASALVVAYLALGGGTYKPLKLADPCKERPLGKVKGFAEVSQQLVLSALDGAACELHVPREELALALTTKDSREAFARDNGISEEVLEGAIRKGLARGVTDAKRAVRLSDVQASVLRAAVETLPIGTLIDAFRTGRGLLGSVRDFLGR